MCYRQALQEGGLPTAQIDPPCCKRSLLLHYKIAFSLSSIRSKASLLALQYGQGTHVFIAQHGEVRAAPRVAHASSAHAVVHAKKRHAARARPIRVCQLAETGMPGTMGSVQSIAVPNIHLMMWDSLQELVRHAC